MLTINEIFYSIQGESTYAGRPCVFVRLTACDLRCSWCDTPYAFDEGQFVVKDSADYEFARDVIRRRALASRCAAILISPVHGETDVRMLSEWILADRLPARLQLQLHKFIWPPGTRGV